MPAASKVILMGFVVLMGTSSVSEGALSKSVLRRISKINKEGPFLGILVPDPYEMNPLILQSPGFVADERFPYLDFAGRRFRLGRIGNEKIIIVLTGMGMVNASGTTQLLLTLFRVKGILHYGIAGNANSNLQIGDVSIPRYWAHTGLWNWQRYGDGPEDELSLESSGDYTRRIGYLRFSDYSNNTKGGKVSGYLLNSVWYQPEEVFPVDGTPEVRQHAFWVPVDKHYYSIAGKLEGMELEGCVNSTTCLPRKPMVTMVRRGCSANTFVDNAAYRSFLNSKFNITPIDMESAAVALLCLQHNTPFITIRALFDLAGGGSSRSNEASIFATLAAQNAVRVLHVPGFIGNAKQLKSKGIDDILLISVNDPFVMKAWGKTYTENKHVKFQSDGSATYTHALGLEVDLSEKGLGVRSLRFALLIDDLQVKLANIEDGGAFTVSSAEEILKAL